MKSNFSFVHISMCFFLIICVGVSACGSRESVRQYTVDTSASAVEWKGYLKDGNGNNGTVQLEGGLSATPDGEITGGTFTMPLSSLININLPSDEVKAQLIHHLQSADFFNSAAHPAVGFTIVSMTSVQELPDTYQAKGELTILGKSLPVDFPVKVNFHDNQVEVTGATSIDRTRWGMNYASDPDAADGMYVKPEIDVQFKLVARRK